MTPGGLEDDKMGMRDEGKSIAVMKEAVRK